MPIPIPMPMPMPTPIPMPIPMPMPAPSRAAGPATRSLTLVLLAALALAPAARAVPALEKHGPSLVFRSGGVTTTVSATSEGALRITAVLDGVTPEPLPWSLDLPAAKGSPSAAGPGFILGGHAVTADAVAGVLSVSTGGRSLYKISFSRTGGELKARLEPTTPGPLYGMGQSTKSLPIGSEKFSVYHQPRYGDQTYLYIPFFISSAGHGFYFNTAGRDLIALKGDGADVTSSSGRIDLYSFDDQGPAQVVQRFYKASGARSLLPRWAYGYLQSKYGYRNEREVRQLVTTMQRFGVPLSAVVLDLYWFKHMGDLDWDREAFPEPEKLIAWLHSQGVRLITISEPFYQRESKDYAAYDQAGAFAKDAKGQTVTWSDWWAFGGQGGGVIDPEAPAAIEALTKRYAALTAQGTDGFWIDLGEPERVPDAARFGGRFSETAFHNFFNLGWAKLVRAGVEKGAPGKRPFLLSRSGWTGISGLGTATWSGDVPATWDGLEQQIPLGLNASLSGLPFWGSDVGGFVSEGGELMPPDPELYLRWQQFGALTPVHRAHGSGAREPWIYGPEWLRHNLAAIRRRAFLQPYVYSTAYQVWTEGMPMMRPLLFEDPADPRLQLEDGAFLLGDSVLVAPVTRPLTRESEKRVHLPKGTWVDAFTGVRHQGGRDLEVKLSLETFPLYYREGAIIPVDLNGAEGLLLLPGAGESRFTVFADDGETEAYRTGAGERLRVSLDARGVAFAGATRARELLVLLPKELAVPGLEERTIKTDALYRTVKLQLPIGASRFDFGKR